MLFCISVALLLFCGLSVSDKGNSVRREGRLQVGEKDKIGKDGKEKENDSFAKVNATGVLLSFLQKLTRHSFLFGGAFTFAIDKPPVYSLKGVDNRSVYI
ncbi:hypothetical protein [Cloacibacillus sp.]|uniref:hypothetical protein n=1 Tax=Cloacibacillus sp. TaxID=2049023 RepID=UPI0025C0F7D1|nr:hypothetical protein [Cloacibacillus sp.]MCC8059032.1 hypothetical protein [Cloacibacillus sp.]